MQQRLEFAITQSISHALRWVDGRFAFHRHLIPIENRMQPLDIDSVLLEALRQADEWEEIETQLTRTAVSRWLPEVNNDVRSLGLSQEYIEVLCLSNGDLPLQAIALVLMMPEARVARIMARLLELRLIEVVDTALETELQQDLSNLIIRCQTALSRQRQSSDAHGARGARTRRACGCQALRAGLPIPGAPQHRGCRLHARPSARRRAP